MTTQNLSAGISRFDYAPLAWTTTRVDLHFRLDPRTTRVTSVLECERNCAAPAGPLRLFGEMLELVSLKLDGIPLAPVQIRRTADGLELAVGGEACVLEIVTLVNPTANTTLSGLYVSRGGFFTQCEAEGFRRITYFPDRPDVMARYTVTLEAERVHCPVLLSNGNLVAQGDLGEGWHFARWEDPFPKPSYLFALVAANLHALERKVTTMSGREVLLQVWVEEANLDRTEHAMSALIDALRWDEQVYGLELDLDRFMIVAVSDFNMGAMENKGLNIFNAKYVLAKPDTATDLDYEGIESVVAHEYFHNWTGNRVTCRDWFQLTLKEGLTVFRDQQFSADMLARAAGAEAELSARAVKRIDDVRTLRSAQFPEDGGPMAHPIRPDSYQEINNFYTATVYEKGAEVIRMLHTLLGREGFRNGMDLYFSYHDGQAVTCDDFVDCMAEANGRDLDPFMRWYEQAGTPRLHASGYFDQESGSYLLTLSQSTPPSPGQHDKKALVIPVAVGLIGPDGDDLPLRLAGETHAIAGTRVLELAHESATFEFVGLVVEPVPSVLRGFSAPVILELEESDQRLAFRMAHDSDAFNRWDAAQRYAERVVFAVADAIDAGRAPAVPDGFAASLRVLINDARLDPGFRALAAALPSEVSLLDRMAPARPLPLRAALIAVMRELGQVLANDWLVLHESMRVAGPYRYHPNDAGRRALQALALRYLAAGNVADGLARARRQFGDAANMTDRMAALAALVQCADHDAADAALAAFHARFCDDALVMDKWFALQAGAWRWDDTARPVLECVHALMDDPAFTRSNPNKAYALLGTFFRANPGEFHRPDGQGYVFWADQVIAIDAQNPQVSARLVRALDNWRRLPAEAQQLVRPELERVAANERISADVSEIVGKALSD